MNRTPTFHCQWHDGWAFHAWNHINNILQLIIWGIQQNIFVRNTYKFAEVIPQIDLLKSNKYYLPEKINRFFDTLSIQKGVSKLLLDIPIASIQVIFGILLLSFYHPIFIGFGLLLLSTLFFILKLTSKKGWTTSLEESKNKYAMVGWFGEILWHCQSGFGTPAPSYFLHPL